MIHNSWEAAGRGGLLSFYTSPVPAHGTNGLRFGHRRAGGGEIFSSPGTAILLDSSQGLRPRTPGYFLCGQKVTKKPHRGGTLSMGSLPYGPYPHDDTKGDVCPPFGIPPALPKVRCETKTAPQGPLRGKPAERLPRKKEAQRSERSLTLASG